MARCKFATGPEHLDPGARAKERVRHGGGTLEFHIAQARGEGVAARDLASSNDHGARNPNGGRDVDVERWRQGGFGAGIEGTHGLKRGSFRAWLLGLGVPA